MYSRTSRSNSRRTKSRYHRKNIREKNKEIVRVVEIKKTGVKILRDNEWQIEGNLILKKGRCIY